MLWRRAITYAIPVSSPAHRPNKNAVPAHLEHNFAVPMAILASRIQSAIIPIPRPAVVAIILADALTQATQNRVQNLVVSSTMCDNLMRKKTWTNTLMLIFFMTDDLAASDIVFADASLSLWACCYQHPGAYPDCSSTYPGLIASSFP